MIFLILFSTNIFAVCGGTTRTWTGTSVTWNTAANWATANVPDTASEDVIISSTGFNPTFATSYSLGCLEVQSGTLNGTTAGITLGITGDYFKAPIQNSLNFSSATFVVSMIGAADQTFEAVDDIRGLRIDNRTSVTLKKDFRILGTMTLVGSGTTIIEGTVQLSATATIPAGHKVIVKNGGTLISSGNLTVNGTLEIEGGGSFKIANGRTLSISSAGSLKAVGSSGNPAAISSLNASSRFTFKVAGSVRLSYAMISRTSAAGMNVTGTIFQLDNTDFRAIINSGYAMTFGAAANIPTTLTKLGFFNDDAVATPKNINANLFNLTAITINLHSGSVAGAGFELDPNSKINWGTTAPVELSISNDAETNEPTVTLAVNTAVTFAEFAFTLNQSSAATDITQIIFTMTGTATMSDLANVRAYRDVDGNCDYTAGTDTQIGSDLLFTGSPLKATLTIPSGNVSTNSSTQQACVILRATAAAAPVDQRTVEFSILSSTDITNSQNYAISNSSGTPSSSGITILLNNTYSAWTGGTSTLWNLAANWSPATIPSATRACQIGVGARINVINTNPIRCSTATLQSGGTLDFNSAANVFEISNSINVASGFNFLNSTSGAITMKGTINQTLSLGTSFPGNVIINNTGTALNKTVSVGTNSTIGGNLTCTAGILNIPNGITLTVLGTITIQTGCTISIEGGGVLALANTRTLTVNTGGTLQMIGTSGLKAVMTSNSGGAAYNVVVNGNIKARYYTFDHLSTSGVSLESTAVIDPTNYLLDGTFSYPVNSSSTLLKLKTQIPGNALSNMNFVSNGSGASSITNIDTTGSSAGTLNITNYSGDLSGATLDLTPSYLINWSGQLNTIALTQEAASPTSVLTGSTNIIGRFGFQQVQAGASYVDTNITKLAITLVGTGTAIDISTVRLYSDVGCTGSGGVQIGTGSFSGNPVKINFNITAGDLIVPAALITTTKVCAYIEYDIAATATNANTVGAKINSSSDFVNSQMYSISTGSTMPITLGAPSTIIAPTITNWTGATSSAWALASNWTAGVPTSAINCSIANATNDPIISTGTASCKNLTITNGILVVNAGTFLDVYGDINKNAGTLTITGTLSIKDNGANINHYIFSNTALAKLTLAKTGTGTVFVNQTSLTITALTMSSATTTLEIPSGKKLVLTNGVTIGSGTLKIAGGGTLELANTRTITVSGGTFKIAGTNDTFPQNLATKGVVQVTGGSTNSYNFTATSGVVDLVGFQFDRLGVNGLNIGGSTVLANLRGGQFTSLSTTYASVKAIQLNTTGSIPASADNIAWNWGAFNVFNGANPTSAQGYKLVSSTGCASHSIDFTGWTGDWYETQPTFDVTTKVSAVSCTITMSAASSAVSLLSFIATPYNAAVDVRWETNVERNHLGFNIYRTTDSATRFVQINKKLIRNLKTSTSNRGSYRFIDNDVTNDQNYYYYLEDVDINGKTTMHGPVFAAPFSILGTPPADGVSENSDSNTPAPGQSGTPSTIPNPTYQDLGNGIVILSQTSKSLRIEITPPTPSFSASSWDGSYRDITMAGYSKMTNVGNPELPEKDILIEVQSFATSAAVTKAEISSSILTNYLISPAPNYLLNGSGVLIPSFVPNSTTYGSNAFYPNQTHPVEFYAIENTLITISNKKFLKLKINPMRYNPVTLEIKSANKVVLDISLDGDDWKVTPPDINSNLGPYSIGNTLKINYVKKGIFQINYNYFLNSQVEAPFISTAVNKWRLYFQDQEIPLEIYSPSGIFSPGDYIRYYAPYTAVVESLKNQLILSPENLTSDSNSAKRMEILDSSPYGGEEEANEVLTTFTKKLEQNLVYVDAFSLGDNLDHYFYKNLTSFVGLDTLSVVAPLPEIDLTSNENVIVKYHVRGQLGVVGVPVKHHVQFKVGGVEQGEAIFEEDERIILSFEVPADAFTSGNNTLEIKLPGTFATIGDYDRLLIDKIEIVYRGQHVNSSEIATVSISDQNRIHTLDSFLTNQIRGYDITNPYLPKKLSNLGISLDTSGITYMTKFLIDNNQDENNLKHYSFLESGNYLKPTEMFLNYGILTSLKNSSNSADLIVYGEASSLVAASDLIAMRLAQGLEVKTVTPEQVYSEFSYGVKTSSALKMFMNTALNNWVKPPRYLLIIGNGTNDPNDFNVSSLTTRSVNERGTLPAPIIPGRFIDFSSDNYFVTDASSPTPKLAVGRIPTNNADKIKAYIEKIRRYEAGTSAPNIHVKKISFIADQDTAGEFEHFNEMSQSMMASAEGFTTVLFDRTILGSAASTTSQINTEFNSGPLMISLVGHGAPDRFGSNIYSTTNASALSNSIYPIVATWNCETAYFYDADSTMKTLGEELIFNPNGGAIVFLGSTTQTTPPAQRKLAQNFFSQLSATSSKPWDGSRIGDILLQSKISVGDSSYEKDIVNSFSILGDPSIALPSDLYPKSPHVPAPAKSGGLFGCSANASDGTPVNRPWGDGLFEWIIYILMMSFGSRIVFRKSRV